MRIKGSQTQVKAVIRGLGGGVTRFIGILISYDKKKDGLRQTTHTRHTKIKSTTFSKGLRKF